MRVINLKTTFLDVRGLRVKWLGGRQNIVYQIVGLAQGPKKETILRLKSFAFKVPARTEGGIIVRRQTPLELQNLRPKKKENLSGKKTITDFSIPVFIADSEVVEVLENPRHADILS